MKKLSKEELNAIDVISSKTIRKRLSEFDIPEITILSLYHKTGRKSNFDSLLNQALDDVEDGLNKVNKVIESTKKQLDNYDRLKRSLILHRLNELK